ncbi:hypothetical protein QFZ69_004663 [Arthrobacter sp. V1I7]|nr:hypothetical protein [Arthrobacter sp. V1I7]MDQ0823717.1 hypothetical protein [Arthrobacter sp. V1I7]
MTATVVSRAEAKLAMAAGADVLCIQGPKVAGRGAVDETGPAGRTLPHVLLNDLSDLGIPFIAASGIIAGQIRGPRCRRVRRQSRPARRFCGQTKPASERRIGPPSPLLDLRRRPTRRLDTEDIGVQFSGRYARGLYDDFTTQPASRCPSDIRKFIT